MGYKFKKMKTYNSNRKPKKTIVSVLLFEKMGFKTKIIIRNKENFTVNKASICQEAITILMEYARNN